MAWLPLQEGGREAVWLPDPRMEMAPPSLHAQRSSWEITGAAGDTEE